MAIISTDNTIASISLIKKSVKKISFILSIFFYICFIAYNIYLIVTNVNNFGRCICYCALFLCTLVGFIFIFIFKNEAKGNNREKNKEKRKRYKLKWMVSIVKYISKFTLVGFAFYDILNNSEATILLKASTIASLFFTISMLIFELSMIIINKYVDYVLLSIELDMKESALLNGRNKIGSIIGYYEEDKENDNYSKYELSLIDDIKDEVSLLDLNKKIKKDEKIETLKKKGLFHVHELIDKVKEKLE